MSIELEFVANPDALPDAAFEIVLSSDQGLVLFVANTETLQVRAPPLPRGMVRFCFQSLAIGAGHVSVAAAALSRNGKPLDHRTGLAAFEILPDGPASGLVRMPVEAEFVAAASDARFQ
jgi:hypothetical protein